MILPVRIGGDRDEWSHEGNRNNDTADADADAASV